MKSIKFLFSSLILLTLFLLVAKPANALTYYPKASVSKAITTPSPTPISEVNSYELFWPLAAGKTADDSLYFLKTLKEDIRGMLIFGAAQKADYKVFLATKRTIEVEELLKKDKVNVANKTLDRGLANLDEAKKSWQKAKDGGDISSATKENVTKQLLNLETFLKWLSTKYDGDTKARFETELTKVRELVSFL